jgi:hypothetical protein
MMNSKIIFPGAGIVAVAAVIALVVMREPGAKTESQSAQTGVSAPQSAQGSESIRQQALAAPEKFQTQAVQVREAPVPLAVPKERPKQLSEIDKPEAQRPEVGSQKSEGRPVALSDLYFHDDYRSMRKEEIRNPDSEENRAGVVALLKARQRRSERR